MCFASGVDFDEQKLDGRIKSGDCSYQQDADQNEGNEEVICAALEHGVHNNPHANTAESMLASMPSQKPPNNVATTMAG